MTHHDRRNFLRLSLAGLASTSLATLLTARRTAASPRVSSKPGGNGRKLLTVFLRGGNDALNTIVPTHDPEYTTSRPTLAVPIGQTLDLGVGGAAFHPLLAKLKEVHDAGFVASVHRVGYPSPTLSHFSSQQFVETAKPGDYAFIEGWTARWAAEQSSGSALTAVSVSPQLMRQFSGSTVLPHVPSLGNYALGNDPQSNKLLVASGGLLSRYASPAGGAAYDPLVHETGDVLGSSMSALAQLPGYTPMPGSFPQTYGELAQQGLPQTDWALKFFQELCDALHILKFSSASIVGVEMPGFDVHSNQGLMSGTHPDRLAVLGHALRSVWHETANDLWPDLVCLVQSEFGRTSLENGSFGTDHGQAGATFVLGGSVIGGVHNCDPQTWPANATLFSASDKYVEHSTDFRAILAEILDRHLLLSPSEIDAVIPGWSSLGGPTFDYVGVLG